MTCPRSPGLSELTQDTRGAVFVEYIIVTVVGILVAVVLAALGPPTVRNYSMQRAALYEAYP